MEPLTDYLKNLLEQLEDDMLDGGYQELSDALTLYLANPSKEQINKIMQLAAQDGEYYDILDKAFGYND